jgi:hypothetical protein
MDVSKLPRLSNTQEQQQRERPAGAPHDEQAPDSRLAPDAEPTVPFASQAPAGSSRPVLREGLDVGTGAEAWLSAILGLVFLLLGRSFGAYLFARMTGQVYHTGIEWTSGPLAGQEVAYPDLQGFTMLNDAAMFLFGLTLLLEAAVIALVGGSFRFQRPLVAAAFGLAVIATAFNLYVVARLMGANVMPIFSLLAVAFGGYIAAYLWKVLRALAATTASAR